MLKTLKRVGIIFNLRTILTITNIKTLGTDTGGVLLC